MKWRRYFVWFLAPVTIGAVTLGVGSKDVARQWARWVGSRPVIEFPAIIDFGEQEEGQVAQTRFNVANRGRGELIVDEISSSCGCAGLEREIDGIFHGLSMLRIPADDQVTLTLRMVVPRHAEGPMKATVTFRTNDPATPQATVQALIPKIIGGVIARPPTIAFGAVPLKHDARRMIEIYDNRTPTRRVAKVLSAWPARVTARYLSSNDAIGPSLGVGSKAVLIGRVELVANSRQPGPLDSEILIHLAGEPCPPDVIRVTGRVADVVVVAPMSLVLPRQSAQGLLYFGDCLCGSSEGKQLVITPDSVPPELTVSITAVKGNPSLQRVRIEWHPAEIKAGGNEPSRLVRLRAKIADQEKLVDIPVYLSSPPRGRT